MGPEPIPDQILENWPGAQLRVFVAPTNHDQRLLEILPVTGVVDRATEGVERFHFKIGVDDRDLELIKNRGWFWLVLYGSVPPFAVEHPEVEDWFEVES